MNLEETIYGSVKCQKCVKNNAYYYYDDKVLCGVCGRKYKDKIQLPKDNKKLELIKDLEYKNHLETCDELKNLDVRLKCTKQYMMKNPELIKGYINIFPNYKDKNRKYGIGLPSLSPKSIGPIDHKQPDLPLSKNLENFHQSNKVFKHEVDEDGNILPIFFETQLEFYNDSIPHRHKCKTSMCLFSLWKSQDGKQYRLSYVQSRQLYCHYYTESVLKNEDYKMLLKYLSDGYNLNIVGYDGYPPTEDLDFHYLDPSKPFGHELVLYTLLKYHLENREDYPWIKFKDDFITF